MLIHLLLLCTLLCMLFVWKKRKFSHLPSPPFMIPWLGHIPLMLHGGDPINHMVKLYKKYGKNGLMYTHTVGVDHLLVGDYKVIKYLFNHPDVSNRGHTKIQQNLVHRKFGYVRMWNLDKPGFGIVLNQGQSWSSQRKMTIKVLHEFGFGKSTVEESVAIEVARFLKLLQNNYEDKPVDMTNKFSLPILNVIWTFTAGIGYDYDNPQLQKIMYLITKWFQTSDSGTASSLMHMSLPTWIFQLFPKFLNRHVGGEAFVPIKKLLLETINEHEETLDENNPRDFIDKMLIEIAGTTDQESCFYKETGKENLLHILVDMFLAGTETTSTTLTWAILYMVREGEVQKRVQEELDRVVGRGRLPMYADKENLPYTEAVIMEIQRAANIGPLGLPHCNSRPINVNGMVIPANTMMSPMLQEVMKGDTDHWGEDAALFRPERFLSPDGKLQQDEQFIPFSVGKRRCPGESLAKIELFQFFAGIVQNYNIVPEDSNHIPTEDYVMGLTLSPKPFKCILNPRS